MNVIDLGQKDYKEVWDLQKIIHQKRVEKEIADTLLLVEHNPVITMGKSGKQNNLLIPFKLLEEKGIAYYQIERGGDVTYHGLGQVVGYPIINIKEGLIGIRPFIERLENVIIATLARFGIKGEKKEKMIGVWTETGKICSIGVAVKRWVSFHGFAFNVNTNLKHFDLIVPCGLKNVTMTSMQKILNKEISLDRVKKSIIKNFGVIFKKKLEERCLKEII
ncbi:lipoyl(octanoyl) transferase LipB [candidate division WOR-3 bacterium]|nr:lipoyl(octanoyl) transferase LipB [candidate division WOR-3 bacterium]